MDHQDIAFWSKVIESSPLIVLILLGGIGLGMYIIKLLVDKLEKKDTLIIGMQREYIEMLSSMKAAIDRLSSVIERSR